jgi:phosphoribosylanthranilate isomerase
VRIRTKICGITSVSDALHAINAGADAIGLVFYKPSPRYVSPSTAREICNRLPPFITVVGLFVDATVSEVRDICREVPLALLQFHGNEIAADCEQFKRPYIKAIRVQTKYDIDQAAGDFPSAQAILVDTYKKGVPGGTGEIFDWSLVPTEHAKPVILAGGLNPENIFDAIQTVKPYAVDVSGGVELHKGVKDQIKVSRFINEVSRACE